MNGSILRFGTCIAALSLLIASPVAASTAFTDVNPSSSDLDAVDPDGASSGRINGLAAVAGDTSVFYAATEWGGIYKSTDSGLTWAFLPGHRPLATWDVEVDPVSTNTVYATSFFDGRVTTLAGINVSTDGGGTWTHPATATPPAGFNCLNSLTEPSAFGIGIRPDASNNVFVGTSCGVAISANSGGTWTFVDPTPLTPASRIWDVVVQPGGPNLKGIVDVCGDDGEFRSTDGGATWTGGAGTLPFGRCSIAASPDESYVLFVAAGDNNIYESDDAGASWTNLGTPDSIRQGRIPFVETNQRSNDATGDRFDLWYGDVHLFSGLCRTPATRAIGGANRCPVGTTGAIPTPYVLPANWSGPFTRCSDPAGKACAHDDVGALVFDTTTAVDSCPKLFSSDGGVFRNTDATADCQNPDWEQPNVTPHALWLFGMQGVTEAGAAAEDLYFGVQDNGVFGSTSAGSAWHNQSCCDGFSTAAETTDILYVRGFFGVNVRGYRLLTSTPGLVGETQINTYPPDGLTPAFNFNESLARFGVNSYVVLMNDCTPGIAGCPGTNGGDGGVFITTDITASPIVWTELGNATEPPSATTTEVQVAVSGGIPTFYVRAGDDGNRRTGGSLWRFDGTNPAGAWQRVDNNDGITGGFNVFAVDPNNPSRLYASNTTLSGPRMVFSTDGGLHWHSDPGLDALMTGNGTFLQSTTQGPTNFTGFGGYPQPSLLAYDPLNSNILVAGGNDSGVFISFNSGGNWGLLTDPFTSNTSGVPHLPRPHYAHFEHNGSDVNVYVGTQGRGIWKLDVTPQPPVAVCKDTTVSADQACHGAITGNDINNGSTDPDGPPPTCTPSTSGPFPLGNTSVTLNCVDSTGLTASCTATVTVKDTTPPTLNCPVSVNAVCTAATGASVPFATSATDNCAGVGTPTCTPTSGTTFALGTRVDTCTVSDANGNQSTCNFHVTVALGDDPVCCPAGTNIILGTSNNNTLNGGAGRDCILGRGGQDTINGNGGDDLISGGDGDDIISGGPGNDMIFGGSGQDHINGDAGNDLISGGDGDDMCFGGDDNDTILGGQGQDQLFGDNGNDTLVGETGDDHIEGGNGDDLIEGDGLHDVCIGGPGIDTFLTCQTQTQ